MKGTNTRCCLVAAVASILCILVVASQVEFHHVTHPTADDLERSYQAMVRRFGKNVHVDWVPGPGCWDFIVRIHPHDRRTGSGQTPLICMGIVATALSMVLAIRVTGRRQNKGRTKPNDTSDAVVTKRDETSR